MRKLISVSAFWRNDHRQGVGLTLTEECGDLEQMMQTITELYLEMYRKAVYRDGVKSLVRDVLDQLEAIGLASKARPMPTHNAYLAIGNIWLLEKFGYLKSDEFNGIMLAYRE